MAIRSRSTLKDTFKTGAKPTEFDFSDLLDSLKHVSEGLDIREFANVQQIQQAVEEQKVVSPKRLKQAIHYFVRLSKLSSLDADVGAKITAAIQNLVGAAPSSLDTLGEIADALNDDANLAATLTNQIANKANKTHQHDTRYYRKTVLDGFFEGEASGKKTVHWDRITNKPSEYPVGAGQIKNAHVKDFSLSANKLSFKPRNYIAAFRHRPSASDKIKYVKLAYRFPYRAPSYGTPYQQIRLHAQIEGALAEYAIMIYKSSADNKVYAERARVFHMGTLLMEFDPTKSASKTALTPVFRDLKNVYELDLYILKAINPSNATTHALNPTYGEFQCSVYSPDQSADGADHMITPTYYYFPNPLSEV